MKNKQKKQPDTKPDQKIAKENPSFPKDKQGAKKKQEKGEVIDPDELTEPITEKVRKKMPKRKPLGPSGQEWDL